MTGIVERDAPRLAEEQKSSSAISLCCRMTAEEELQLGLRRGRSARAASPPLDLPPNRRVRQTEGLRNPARLSMEPSSERGNASVTPSEDQPAQRASEEDDPSASPSPLPAADQRILNGISSKSLQLPVYRFALLVDPRPARH